MNKNLLKYTNETDKILDEKGGLIIKLKKENKLLNMDLEGNLKKYNKNLENKEKVIKELENKIKELELKLKK